VKRARKRLALAVAASIASCSLFTPQPPAGEAAIEETTTDTGADREAQSLEEEEISLEGLDDGEAADGDPIARLIASFGAPADPAPAEAESATATSAAATAYDVWSMTDEACSEALAAAGVAVSKPGFETPSVRQPLLLDGPIDGVAIRPKARRPVRLNEVMDCRLIVALRAVAGAAREQGFREILFYSTYRPTKDKAKAGKASMHRRGLAIDVGWLTAADGTAVEVLSGYERRSGEPPCEAAADTDVGRRLRDFACALHARKIFNVVLTPNANEAHHNHFHFDITPNARWYIVR
jgi:hypothetical protein